MASEYDPLVRSLHSESEEDIALAWCPSEGDHGKCTAYLAQVIAVDHESQHAQHEEEESDHFQALGNVGEEISRGGELEDENIAGEVWDLPLSVSCSPPSPPPLEFTLSATEECRSDPFIENGVHVTHNISGQTPSFPNSTRPEFIFDDFSDVTNQINDDMTSYRSTLCIIESDEDALSISEKEQGKSSLIDEDINSSDQFMSKQHTPRRTPSFERLLKQDDVGAKRADQTGDDISYILSNSGLKNNEANENFSVNLLDSSTDALSVTASGESQMTQDIQMSNTELTASCDRSYPKGPMRHSSFLRLSDEDELEDESYVTLHDSGETSDNQEDVDVRIDLHQEQNNAREETKAASPPPLPLLISEVSEDVVQCINLARSPVKIPDPGEGEVNSDREGKEETEETDDKDGYNGISDAERDENKDRNVEVEDERMRNYEMCNQGNEGVRIEIVNNDENGNEEIKDIRVHVIDRNNGLENEDRDGFVVESEKDTKETNGNLADKEREGTSEGIENDDNAEDSDGSEGISSLFEMNDEHLQPTSQAICINALPPIMRNHESDDNVNLLQISQKSDDADDHIKVLNIERSEEENESDNDDYTNMRYVLGDDYFEGHEGNNEITGEIANDMYEIENDSEEGLLDESLKTFAQEKDLDVYDRESEWQGVTALHSNEGHNEDDECDVFDLVSLFTKPDEYQHREASLMRKVQEDINRAYVADDDHFYINTSEDRMKLSTGNNDLLSSSSSGHNLMDSSASASAINVDLVSTTDVVFVSDQKHLSSHIGKNKAVGYSANDSEDPVKDFALYDEENVFLDKQQGQVSESEDIVDDRQCNDTDSVAPDFETIKSAAKCQSSIALTSKGRSSFLATLLQGSDTFSNDGGNIVDSVSELDDRNYFYKAIDEDCKLSGGKFDLGEVTEERLLGSEVIDAETSDYQHSYHQTSDEYKPIEVFIECLNKESVSPVYFNDNVDVSLESTSKVPNLFVPDHPDFSIPIADVPNFSIQELSTETENSDLSISEVHDLSISGSQQLSVSEEHEVSVVIPESSAQDYDPKLHSEPEVVCPKQEKLVREIPAIILTSFDEVSPEEGNEENDDSSLSLSEEDELVSSVITVIAADQFETKIEEVEYDEDKEDVDGDDNFSLSASINIDGSPEDDVTGNNEGLEVDLIDDGEVVKNLSSTESHSQPEEFAQFCESQVLPEDSFSGWVNQVCSVFCHSDSGIHDRVDRIIPVSHIEEKDISGSQIIEEYPSKIRFPESDEKVFPPSSHPVVLNSECGSDLRDEGHLVPEVFSGNHDTSPTCSVNLHVEANSFSNSAESEDNEPVISLEKTEDLFSYSESISCSTLEKTGDINLDQAKDQGNCVSSAIEIHVDCIHLSTEDRVYHAQAGVNEEFNILLRTDSQVNDFPAENQTLSDSVLPVNENQVEEVSNAFVNHEGEISHGAEYQGASLLNKNQENETSPVPEFSGNRILLFTENQESDISLEENQEDLSARTVKSQEDDVSSLSESHDKENDNILYNCQNQEDVDSSAPDVSEIRILRNLPVIENQEDRISPVNKNQEDKISAESGNQEYEISLVKENQEVDSDQEHISSTLWEESDQNFSENQNDYFDDSQVYYIPLVDEEQEFFPLSVTEDQKYSHFFIGDQEYSVLSEDREYSAPAEAQKCSSDEGQDLSVSAANKISSVLHISEDQVDFSLQDEGRLTKYVSLVDKDNCNYSLCLFEEGAYTPPLVSENQENCKHYADETELTEGEIDVTDVTDYNTDVITSITDNYEPIDDKESRNETVYLEEISPVKDHCELRDLDVPFRTKSQDNNDNSLLENRLDSVCGVENRDGEFLSGDHKDSLSSEIRDEVSLTHAHFEEERDFNCVLTDSLNQDNEKGTTEENITETEIVVHQEEVQPVSGYEEKEIGSEENSDESEVAYSSSLLREVERIDFIGGVIGGVKEGWHSLPSSAVEGKLPFDSFLSVIEEEDQVDSIPTGIDRDRTDSSPPVNVVISEEELQVPSVPIHEEEEEEEGAEEVVRGDGKELSEEGKEGTGEGEGNEEGLLTPPAPSADVGCVELRNARDDLNSKLKLPEDEVEDFGRETNVDDIDLVAFNVEVVQSSEEEVERETLSKRETLLEISRANRNEVDEVSGFNGESKLRETSEGAAADSVCDAKEELGSFVGSSELQGRSESVVEKVDEGQNSVESVLYENLSGSGFDHIKDDKEECSVDNSIVKGDETQAENLDNDIRDADGVMKSSVSDENSSLESKRKAKERESSLAPCSSLEESLLLSSESSIDTEIGQQEPSGELTRTDMSESSNRDSGTSYLSEADTSDNDTLVGRSSDGDGMVMSSSSSSEEGTITSSKESSNISINDSNSDVNFGNFSKGHRRDDSGVVMGNFPVDAAHHIHHTQRQDTPQSPHASQPHYQRAGGENGQHCHHHCHYHVADHHCHHHHHHHHNQNNANKRSVEDDGSYTEPEDNNRTLERGMSPVPADPDDDDGGSVKGFPRNRNHQFRMGRRRFSGANMMKKMKKVVHFGKKSSSDDDGNHPHHTKVQEAMESESFGKRSGGGGRRTNECLILEPSEMIVIDYPDVQLMRPGQRASCNTMSLEKLMALEQDEVNIRPVGRGAPPPPPGHHHSHSFENEQIHGQHIPHPHDPYLPDLVMGSGILRGARSRGSVGSSVRDGSDTSSAYSGSDTMCHSLHSSLEPDDVDLSGLTESAVDSDEEDLAESMESLAVRDCVRECLEKDPSERSEDDIEILLEFTQRLQAFSNMTLAVRRDMCQAMVFAVVEDAGTILMHQGEELDSWSVIINGHVEVTQSDGTVHELNLGDSFGITPTMEKLYHQGIMRSKVDDCQFVCIRQTDYYRILHRGEENTRRVEENGIVVLVTEQRPIDGGNRKGNIVIKGTSEKLMGQLVEVENNVDPTYVEDFLLTHRTFVDKPLTVANKLLHWFEDPTLRDRVTRVVLLWVNNHFTDFEMDLVMMNFLEQFEEGLEREKMAGQLRLLDFACATKARARIVTLTRPSRDEILHFSILGGYERGHGIFISKVEKGSKAEEVGLKRGDQILEVNGQSFDHMNHARALEILRQPCHLSITVKSNLLAFKEMLSTPDNSPRPHARKTSDVRGLSEGNGHMPLGNFGGTMASDQMQQSPRDKGKDDKNKSSFMTIGASTAKQFKKKIINSFVPKQTPESHINSDESVSSQSSVGGGGLYHSHSNPDLSTAGAFEDVRTEFPEHVLRVYRATDHSSRFLPVHKETTAREVVMLALQIFNINDPSGSSNYALYEVTVTEEGITKQRRLLDSLQNLAERIGLSSRYYLKNITVSQTHVPDDIVSELVRESAVCFLQLNSVELAVQLTLEDYTIFRQIEPTEYIDYLFNLKSNYGTPALSQFAGLVNHEMFWVVTEVCSEHNLVKRSKIIKQFIKVARQCKECKNFNSMFAILSGLGHGAVSRLKQTWERLPTKYMRMFQDMQDLMDPSRNMSKYRNLVQNENIQSPIIPFYPVVARDLTFTHEGNDDKVDGLINFEKLRMISRYIRDLQNMCSAPYDLFSIQDAGGQAPSSALISLNQMAAGGHQIATVKRRKKSTAAPDKKKMYEEAQMVRRVKAYLSRLQVVKDEDQLRNMSLECEGGPEGHKAGGSTGSQPNNNNNGGSSSAPPSNQPPRRRPHSPTPSTTSSTSSTSQTSDGKKQTAKFGATSPQSISKMKALAEPKTKPHHGPRSNNSHHHSLSPSPSPGPPRKGALTNHNPRSNHERSHSDTHAVPVDLSAESSSVTSLSKLHKSHTSGSVTSNECQVGPGESDSGISTHFDCHSSSSLEVGGVSSHEWQYHSSPPAQHRRYSHQPESRSRPPFPHAIPVLPPVPTAAQKRFMFNNMRQHCVCNSRVRRGAPGVPPDYVATQQRMKLMGRALSHDGVQYYHHSHHDDEEEDAQVSAV